MEATLGVTISDSETVTIAQCRDGSVIWTGAVRVYNSVDGGETGDSHGRRNSGAADGQFVTGDLLVPSGSTCSLYTSFTKAIWDYDTDTYYSAAVGIGNLCHLSFEFRSLEPIEWTYYDYYQEVLEDLGTI